MASPQLSITRKTPLDSFDLALKRQIKRSSSDRDSKGEDAARLTAFKYQVTPRIPSSDQTVATPIPSANTSTPGVVTSGISPSGSRRPSPEGVSNNGPCPDERKLLVDCAAGIAHNLLRKFRGKKSESIGAEPDCSCVHCGGSRPCGPGCCCPCHGFFAPRTCAETLKNQADKGPVPFPEPPDPETITECTPQQLRAGKFLTLCDCTKRNGLQHLCRRWGCSEKCPRMRPKQRGALILGDPLQLFDSTPRCCAGKMQAEMYRMMEAKVDEMIKKTRNPRVCERPYVPPKPGAPPPFNWNGIFPHVCRQPGDECKGRAKPFPKIPCNPGCKHWTVPRPCTYPICRADCYEDPPPRPPPPRPSDLAASMAPYIKQETC